MQTTFGQLKTILTLDEEYDDLLEYSCDAPYALFIDNDGWRCSVSCIEMYLPDPEDENDLVKIEFRGEEGESIAFYTGKDVDLIEVDVAVYKQVDSF